MYFIIDPTSQVEHFVKIRSEVWELKHGKGESRHSDYLFIGFTVCKGPTYCHTRS
jgi:hypothetical protein